MGGDTPYSISGLASESACLHRLFHLLFSYMGLGYFGSAGVAEGLIIFINATLKLAIGRAFSQALA